MNGKSASRIFSDIAVKMQCGWQCHIRARIHAQLRKAHGVGVRPMRRIDGRLSIFSAIASTPRVSFPSSRLPAFLRNNPNNLRRPLVAGSGTLQFPVHRTYYSSCKQSYLRSTRCGSMATMQLLDRARLLPATGAQLVSPASSRSCVVGVRALPVCRGLRWVGSKVVSSSPAASPSARSRRRRVACEAQETVTGVTGVVNESTWKSLVGDGDVPVLVDFWAPWCGPCRMIAPIIDEIAKKYAGKVRCLKLNTDESPNIATEYGIRSIPTVMVFLKGEKIDTVIGAVPMQTLTSTLEKYIAW